MKYERLLFFLFSISIIFLGCAGTTLKDYKVRSLEEAKIKAVLSAYESAWNEHDSVGFLALLHEEFVIWAGSERSIVYARREYAFVLRDRMRKYRVLRLGKPAMSIIDDKATVFLPMSVDGRNIRNTFHLIRKNGEWFFLSSEF